MPNPCVLEIGLNGDGLDAIGLPTRLAVYARVQGPCARVRFRLRADQGSPVIWSGEATPDSNGTAVIEFPIEPPAFPCGFRLWLEAECIEGATCSTAALLPIQCKRRPTDGGGATGPGDSGGGGGGGWPWPQPPQLFCPLIGRAFTTALLAGLVLVLTSIALVLPAGIAAGLAVIAGAFALLAIWTYWCIPNNCYLRGAILWAVKRAAFAGILLSVFSLNVACALATFALCVVGGVLTARLRRARCPIPTLAQPLQQLPLW